MPTGPPFQPDPSQLYAQEFEAAMRPEYDAQRAQLGVTQAANQKMAADYLAHIQGMQNPIAAQQVPNAPNPLMAGLAGFFAHLNASQTGSQVLPSALMNALAQAGHQRATVQAANADSNKDFALGKLKIEEEAYKGMLDMQHQAAVESGNLEAAFAAQKAKYTLAATQHKRETAESEASQERLSVASDKRIMAREMKTIRAHADEKANPPDEDTSWIDPLVKTTRSGHKFVDVGLMQGKEKGIAIRHAGKNGYIPVSGPDADQLNQIDNARGNMDDIEAQITGILPKDASGRTSALPGIKMSELFQTSDERAAFGSFRAAAIQTLRAMAGSKGLRINKSEIETAMKNDIPQITDTLATARRRLRNVRGMLIRAENPIVNQDWGKTSSPAGGAAASDSTAAYLHSLGL